MVEKRQTIFDLDWAYGLTDSWRVGLEVPLRHQQTVVRSSVEMAPSLSRAASQAGGPALGGDVHEKIQALANQQLSDWGYDAVPDEKQNWSWGDVTLLSQISLVQDYNWRWSLQQQVRFPTSQNSDSADYIQSLNDDGQMDLGLNSLLD